VDSGKSCVKVTAGRVGAETFEERSALCASAVAPNPAIARRNNAPADSTHQREAAACRRRREARGVEMTDRNGERVGGVGRVGRD